MSHNIGVLLLLGMTLVGALSESVDQRRVRIEQMSPESKQQLLDKSERFHRLPADEQERLRKLQAALESDPEAEKLIATLDQYYQWLLTLSAPQRAELNQLDPTKRIEQIKQILADRRNVPRPMYKPLSPEDREVVRRWVEKQVLANLPPDRREEFDRLPQDERRKMSGRMFMQRLQPWDASKRLSPALIELTALREQLSEAARSELAQVEFGPQRMGIVTNWIMQSLDLSLNETQLRQFFEHDLPTGEKQRLLSLPAEEMRRELGRLYMRSFGREGSQRFESNPRFDGGNRPGMQGTPGPQGGPSRGDPFKTPGKLRPNTPSKNDKAGGAPPRREDAAFKSAPPADSSGSSTESKAP